MAEPKPRKVIALVKCTTVELKLTLNQKTLAKPLCDALITPYLGVYNKKKPEEAPLTADSLSCVTVDGVLAADLTGIADKGLSADNVTEELFPPGTAPPAAAPPAAAPPAASPPAAAKAPEETPPPAKKAAVAPPPPSSAGGENPLKLASNTMPVCKYGLACRIITPEEECTTNLPKEQQHWYKFQHPCFWVCKEGHPELGPPGVKVPLHTRFGMSGMLGRGGPCPPCLEGMIQPCTNMDPDHRRCFRHPEDDEEVVEVIDETPDEMDEAVLKNEQPWAAPDVGTVSEDDAMEAKMAAAEAMSNGDLSAAVTGYSKALAGNPSALTYAKRAEALLKLGHPTAAIADCDKALEMNPDSAKTYKVAAKALTKKGEWQAAYAKICIGNKIDEDEDSALLLKQLKAKVDREKKIAKQKAKREEAAAEQTPEVS